MPETLFLTLSRPECVGRDGSLFIMLISTLSYAPGQATIVVPGCDEKGLSSFFCLCSLWSTSSVYSYYICLILCIVCNKIKRNTYLLTHEDYNIIEEFNTINIGFV